MLLRFSVAKVPQPRVHQLRLYFELLEPRKQSRPGACSYDVRLSRAYSFVWCTTPPTALSVHVCTRSAEFEHSSIALLDIERKTLVCTTVFKKSARNVLRRTWRVIAHSLLSTCSIQAHRYCRLSDRTHRPDPQWQPTLLDFCWSQARPTAAPCTCVTVAHHGRICGASIMAAPRQVVRCNVPMEQEEYGRVSKLCRLHWISRSKLSECITSHNSYIGTIKLYCNVQNTALSAQSACCYPPTSHHQKGKKGDPTPKLSRRPTQQLFSCPFGHP